MNIGKMIIYAGFVLILLGLLWMVLEKLGLQLGRLPGDIIWKKGNTTVYFPIVTGIVLSVVFSILLWLFKR